MVTINLSDVGSLKNIFVKNSNRKKVGAITRLKTLCTGNFEQLHSSSALFVESQSYEKGFAPHYQEHVLPHLVPFEETRLNVLLRTRKRFFLLVPLWIMVVVAIMLFVEGEAKFNLTIFATIIAWTALWWPLRAYEQDVKAKVFPNVMSFFTGYKYLPNIHDRMCDFKEYGVVPSYDEEVSEDRVSGTYKGVDIELFETNLVSISRDSKGRRRRHTKFDGLVITFSMHKSFNGKTIITKDSGKIGNWFKDKANKLENVKLEDPQFEKQFEVYGTDQIEARYLLTTAFMQRLLNLQQSTNAKSLQCSFYQDKLLIMITSSQFKDFLEPGSVFLPADFIDDCKMILQQIDLIHGIVDELKLNQNIGM